ncbi:hypothetical protein PR048_015205 [Dryococelus australis]|uniref:Uncharacterized protein n=1 Tax=Dryococelus australis TaxID=614101 RepID=A0ABQ9HGA5_9NEOP|nr:hypothetical protein PR048_015205 [Dryococelus australis]
MENTRSHCSRRENKAGIKSDASANMLVSVPVAPVFVADTERRRLSLEVLRADVGEVSMEQRRNVRTGETRDPRENTLTSVIVRHNSHVLKSGSDPAGNRNPAPTNSTAHGIVMKQIRTARCKSELSLFACPAKQERGIRKVGNENTLQFDRDSSEVRFLVCGPIQDGSVTMPKTFLDDGEGQKHQCVMRDLGSEILQWKVIKFKIIVFGFKEVNICMVCAVPNTLNAICFAAAKIRSGTPSPQHGEFSAKSRKANGDETKDNLKPILGLKSWIKLSDPL